MPQISVYFTRASFIHTMSQRSKKKKCMKTVEASESSKAGLVYLARHTNGLTSGNVSLKMKRPQSSLSFCKYTYEGRTKTVYLRSDGEKLGLLVKMSC